MVDSPTPDSRRQPDRPRLRCPACSALVMLPAETCPQCGADLRTGQAPEPPAEAGRRGRLVLGVVMLAVIVGLAVFFFGLSSDRPAAKTGGEPMDRSGLGESLDTVERLAEQPVGAGSIPAAILNRAHDAADQVEDNQRQADGQVKDSQREADE